MVAAARTMICLAIAVTSLACGVVLPPAEDVEEAAPDSEDPVTTKGANMPAPSGSNADAGTSESGSPGTPGTAEEGGAPAPSPPLYRVFVTSQVWASDEIGGLTGADAKCASRASTNPALTGKKWKAWLSSGTSAVARLGTTPGPWVRVDGIGVATSRDHLSDKNVALFAPIALDEQNTFHTDSVWTGTRSGGAVSSDTCNGWNGTMGRGLYGRIDFAKPHWTEDGDVECDGGGGSWQNNNFYPSIKPRNRLYCFEVD